MVDRTADVWRVATDEFPLSGSSGEQATFLLRYAILAPSSHNTQPWTFRVEDRRIDVQVDDSRWLRVADADRRELYLSVGCALENLLVAAEHFGLAPRVRYLPGGDNAGVVAEVKLADRPEAATPPRPTGLFEALERRHTNRRAYDARPIPAGLLADLAEVTVQPDIEIRLTDEPRVRQGFVELTRRADALQFADPEWRQELGCWIGQGTFGTNRVMSKAAQLAVTHLNLSRSTAKKDHELLRSAPVLGLVVVDEVSRESQIRAGQAFERLFLAATEAGLALQPMNQILQVPETRVAFHELIPGAWGSPQLIFRLGYAKPGKHTPRRTLDQVIRLARNAEDAS